MVTKEITICGKQVVIAYCYATEIIFKKYTGKNIDQLEANDPEHIVYLILAAVMPYYESKDLDAPIRDIDLMYKASQKDMLDILTQILKLRRQWYDVPDDEPKENQPEDKKNV